MARTLAQRIIAEIGISKIVKYFPGPESNPEAGDVDSIDEFAAESLREMGERIPFLASEPLVFDENCQVQLSPFGRTAPRRLAVHEVWNTRLKVPAKIPESKIDWDGGYPRPSSGWYVDGTILYVRDLARAAFPTQSTVAYGERGVGAGDAVKVVFKVSPVEDEIRDNPIMMRAATALGAARALEVMATKILRPNTIRLEGVPDVRSMSAEFLAQAKDKRKLAYTDLGSYVIVV